MTDEVMKGLTQTVERFSDLVVQFLPRLLVMVIIITFGWAIAMALKLAIRRVLTLMKFNALWQSDGTQPLLRADLPPPTEMLSRLVFWVVWVGFILLGISTLGVVALQEQISRFFFYVPQIFLALLILIIGLLMANFVARAILLTMVNANVPSARLLSTTARFFVLILTVAMALEQVALAKSVVLITFSIAFGAVMFGLAIAFGLGGRDAAKRLLERQFPDRKEERDDDISHL